MTVAPLVSRWVERLLAEHEPALTLAQFLMLRAIASGAASGAELARLAGVSGPAISQLVRGLGDAGLIERRELREDRRRQEIALSASGEQTLASAQTHLRDRLSAVLAELPRPEADALSRALPQVEAMLTGAPPPRRPRPTTGPPPPPPPRHRQAHPD